MWALALVVLVAGIVVSRPDLSLHAERPPGAATPTPSAAESRDGRGPRAAVLWDARGDLAGDREFVRAALVRVRQERPEVARVFYAGTLSDGSRLLLAGTDVNRGMVATSVHALHVLPGAPVEGGRLTEAAALVDPQQVLGWAVRGPDGVVRAVALTRPGPVRFEVSARVDFSSSDGTPERRWTPVRAVDGVAVADLGADTDPIITLRATGPGVFALPLLVRVLPSTPDQPEVLTIAGASAPGYSGPDVMALARGLRAQAGSVVDLAEADLEVLWSGAPSRQRRFALVLLTRPDGRRFQALVGQQRGAEFPAGVRALADGAPDRLPWLLEPFSPQDPTLLLCPTGDGSVIYRRPGRPTRTLQIGPDGVVSLVDPGPSPPGVGGAEVTVLDTAGRILIRTRLPQPGFDDPLALD